ncbi:MAG: anaerobic glycerol-3-phosphate dehydrogenase subunit GlpA [Roseiflexus sp.]|nr:anaerobic glycerol-3-phosphate dehydrogenase subunit GlpA [Roseiflexus sp.]MCS7291024.1 anaerobic glycerol-3-phosphate dehydrogenase subunit GlpA [Roseiflexus sp.]MDW8233423.1 anaerobic glycerol-3-phosphate dehydrogenase subunit GlpA [Roseiflexaceae bacterium]
MRTLTTDVLVIGGGATGAGVLRDLALRGIRCALVEKGDLTHGTTGRYHGLLHSGARYVVKDPQSAEECARENEILRKIIPHCIEETGGLFVVTPADDESYADRFVAACRRTGVWVEEIPVREALRREPLLNPRIRRAFAVRDGAADSFLATHANADDAQRHGAQVLTYHRVVGLERVGDRIIGAVCEDLRSGETVRIHASFIINATGAWAGKIAAMAGLHINVVPGKGTMIAMNHRIVNTVINRCKMPSDGDIIVPIHTVAVLGTTDIAVPDPDVYDITPEEVRLILEEGECLVPGVSRMRALRAWAGVRPLYRDQDAGSNRDISRTYKLLDHETRDGVAGMVSIVGGKWTTYRLMAEQTVNLVAQRLGVTTPCRTADLTIEPSHTGAAPAPHSRARSQFAILASPFYMLGHRLAEVEADDSSGDLICECELVTRTHLEAAIHSDGTANLDDLRRDTRLGMGPCQGGFCTYRAAAIWHELRNGTAHPAGVPPATALLRHFLQERWKGVVPTLWGDQLRQERLNELNYLETLAVDRLPETGRDVIAQGRDYVVEEVV